ncbi:hypothetical protein OQJ18_04010 [Fluoribacter dumoffii]|uniref:Uncharacterized protein n=1 Tax=Fluoribacter dumoffii TaxID=463 RepID=A0A377G9N4_9GAMM|nr:hypothetical protein [Fluoribacter dumoffii]KTC93523.1 hypothetical protein Ldum_0043 [Fluoribacter dumoffii NY 23]MCW8418751.1 hypothetical protein [Fluoribacter dumoffii]MCW8453405.1 hypothetical protein [Fluoribacter dumoffii]MCW8459375.1 hypothetical protein [Fluoribacter dumoffii]MCW8482734.1 hypothetical protein [Fluoribacter dumoffii]
MVQIVYFTDPGKDGDDLIATVHLIMQAKKAGIIDPLTPIKLVTTDEIPCDEYGVQKPDGKYGLRALYLKMQIEKLQKQLDLPTEHLPEIIPGPVTTYYSYDEELKKYHYKSSESDAFYPTAEVIEYYQQSEVTVGPEYLLSSSENAWTKKIKHKNEETVLVNIASFNGIEDFLSQIPPQEQKKFKIFNMGYNKPYSAEDYQNNTANTNSLPYNERSTAVKSAAPVATALAHNNVFHIVSGTTRTLPKYTQITSMKGTADVLSRSFPLLSGHYAPVLLTSIVEFIKNSKHKGFWPHDAVATLMALIEISNWKPIFGTDILKEMLFTDSVKVPAHDLRLRVLNGTGILIDSSVPADKDDIAIESDEHFIYGKEIDSVFFTSLLHAIALSAFNPNSDLLNYYLNIIKLKSEVFYLRQEGKTDSVKEKSIKSFWIKANLLELQHQLELQVQGNPNEAVKFILGAEALEAENKQALRKNILKWIREISAFLHFFEEFDLPESIAEEINKAFLLPTTEKKLNALTGIFVNHLRTHLMPSERSCDLLKQEEKLAAEFKRTGNSVLYYHLAAENKFDTAFSDGILGMSSEYKKLLRLEEHSPTNKAAFYLHLALHDAGKGDFIKNAVHKDAQGDYIIHLPSGNYVKISEAKEISSADALQFVQAKEYVDHDLALEFFGYAGSKEKDCSATEYLLFGGPAPKQENKQKYVFCDELFNLCNEMNIAQIVQGEIPFSGIKKGLDLFFAAYKQNPKLAELVFVHHCYDIFGAAALDSMVSITGNSPEIHLKINLLYQVLVDVAQQQHLNSPAEEAYTLYRKKLAAAIPDILNSKPSSHDLAVTRIAQMLRCHLFRTSKNPDNNQITINEEGQYEPRTRLFVESIDAAFHQLPRRDRHKLISFLDNTGTEGNPAVMVMYGPKLFLSATTGGEFASPEPTDKKKITECLMPMLKLYMNLYEFQSSRSTKYSSIDVNDLSLIVSKVFTWYKDADKQQKERFARLLFILQKNGQANAFLNQLGDIKSKTASEQLTKLEECLKNIALPPIVLENLPRSENSAFATKLRTIPIQIIYADLKKARITESAKNDYKKRFLTYVLEHLAEVSEWQIEAKKAWGFTNDIKIHRESIFAPDSPKEAANKALLEVIRYLIIDTQWDIGWFGGEKVSSSEGSPNIVPKGMYAVLVEIEKAQKGQVTFTTTVEQVTRMVEASALKRDHGFFNKRGETTQIFYDKVQELLKQNAEETFASIPY